MFHVHGLEDSIFVKTTIIPKAMKGSNAIPIKIRSLFLRNRKAESKINMELQEIPNK